MDTCMYCKHWDVSDYVFNMGRCIKIEHFVSTYKQPYPRKEQKAFVKDAEDMCATLYTHQTFGCTEFEG